MGSLLPLFYVVLFIRFCVEIAPNGNMNGAEPADKGKRFIDIIITAVTIVVVDTRRITISCHFGFSICHHKNGSKW